MIERAAERGVDDPRIRPEQRATRTADRVIGLVDPVCECPEFCLLDHDN